MSAPSDAIRFVYFDLGNVLVAFDRNLACDNIARLFSSDRDTADRILHDSGFQTELETGRITEETFAVSIRDAFRRERNGRSASCVTEPQVSTPDILRAISDMFSPIESMRDVLRRLRDSGVPIGVLSNTCAAHWSWVNSQDYGVLEGPFHVEIVSYEALSMKPDRCIYEVAEEAALKLADASPSQILFLDDREENVLAAQSFGWQAEVCLGGEQAVSVLQRYGVLQSDYVLEPAEGDLP